MKQAKSHASTSTAHPRPTASKEKVHVDDYPTGKASDRVTHTLTDTNSNMFSRSRFYELLCISTMGVGQMLMMTGYNTQSFVAESVLHSIHSRSPELIDSYAGYYGQALMYLVYTFSNLFAPSLLHLLGPKWIIFLGSMMITCYQLGFLHLNQSYFYISCALMGLGFALFYAGQGIYMTSHSSMRTISRNSVLVWTINSGCMLVGGGILALIFFFGATPSTHLDFSGNATETHVYRQFSDHEVTVMYGVLTAIGVLSNVVFLCLPSEEVKDSLSSVSELKWDGLFKHVGEQLSTCIKPQLLLLAPLFMHWGMFTSFWVGVYPTTLVFTRSLSDNVYLPALYAIAVGCGEIGVGLLVSSLSHRYPQFGLRPTLVLCVTLSCAAFSLIAASTPRMSSILPNDEEALLFDPSVWSVLLIAFLLGSTDACLSTVRGVICAIVIPERRSHVFSSGKFYQSLAGCLIFFFSPKLPIYECLGVMSVSLIVAAIGFWIVSCDTKIHPDDVKARPLEEDSKSSDSTQLA